MRPRRGLVPRSAGALAIFALAFATRWFYAEDLLSAARLKDPAATFAEAILEVTQKFTIDYELRARNILAGGGILYTGSNPPRLLEIAHPPGYQVFIAAVYSVASMRLRSVSQAQILLDAACAALVGFCAAGLFGTAAGLASGVLIALSPHLAYNALVPMPDTPSAWPIVVAMLLVPRAVASGRWPLFLAIGLLMGVSCWLRANALLLAALVAFLVWRLRPQLGWGPAAMVLATTYLVISPITIRNYLVYDVFLPLGWGAGRTLVEGIADYDFENRFDFPRFDRDITKWDDDTVKTHLDRETLLEKKALAVIARHPFWFASVVWRRALFQWSYDTDTDTALDTPFHTRIQPPVAPQGRLPWLRALVRGFQGLYATWVGRALSVLGVVALLVSRRRAELAVFLVVPLYYLVFQSLLHTEYRYCLVIHYFLFTLIGVGIVETWHAVTRRFRIGGTNEAP